MKRLRWYDYITLNIYWLGITTVSQSNGLIIPLLVQRFEGTARQGELVGTLRLYSLMVALLVQALMGMLSDHSTLRWGRRRPFILVGGIMTMVAMIAIGASTGYWMLFAAAVFSQITANTAHGAEQGLIPDLVPEENRGRASGAKAVMELLPVILVALTVARLIEAGQMWAAISVSIIVLAISTLLTMFVREEQLREPPGRLDWQPFGRLVLMTLVFMAIILGLGEASQWIAGRLEAFASPVGILVTMGVVGVVAMTVTVVLGVWACVRISLGREEMRQNRAFAWWVVSRLAFLVGVNNMSVFAVYFLQGRLGIPGEAAAGPASLLMAVVGVLILIFAVPSGWLADRIGRKGLVIASGIVGAVGVAVVVSSPSMTIIYIGGAIIGAATGTFFASSWALGTDLAPRETAGRYLGLSNLAGAGAGAVGAYIGGPIADFVTANAPILPGMGYILLFGIFAFMLILSAIVLLTLQDPPQS
jgi:MFS family permease